MIRLKEKMYAAIHKYIVKNNEFSKRFTLSIRNFMFAHVSLSFISCVVQTVLQYDWAGIIEILTAMMPVYIALQGANYVKSGFENWKKISKSEPEDVVSEEESVDG